MTNKAPNNNNTKIKEINDDVLELKADMKKNVRGVIGNLQTLEPLVQQTDDIKGGAKIFEKDAINVNYETKSCCQKYCPCCTCCNLSVKCVIFTIGFVGFIVLAYFTIALIRCHSVNIACSS
jgi:hypothetical protein